jgi:hypothetical protein
MTAKTDARLAAPIFAIVALLQLARAYEGRRREAAHRRDRSRSWR